MKTKQMTPTGVPGMVCLALMLAVIFPPFISCKKNNTAPAPPLSLQTMADKLQGEILNGSLSTESDEDGIALWCNDGKTLIGMEKILTLKFTDPGNIRHARVVYSNYGIIIRDMDSNKLWYYIQNDDKSKKQFEELHHPGESPVISRIAGTIKLNLS
ncbi:MAG: hypothetical protein ABJC98_12670 [Bacteroidota bacterium]